MEQEQNDRIRISIIAFGIFASLVLFQPPRIGTIAGAAVLLITMLLAFSSRYVSIRSFKMDFVSNALLLFVIDLTMVSLAMTEIGGWYFRFVSQILLFLVMYNVSITKRESDFIKTLFIASNGIYAILIIRSCMAISSRYYHDDISILGATFDPNFIGLSLVATTGLVLNQILNSRKKLFYILMYIVCVVAIALTGSRGNFVGLLISNCLVIFYYLRNKNTTFAKRVVVVIGIIVLLLFFMNALDTFFPSGWARMSQISEYSDNGRYRVWSIAFNDWKEHPVFGNGFRSMLMLHDKVTHNTYIELLNETGIIGVVLFCSFLFSMINKIKKIDKVLFSISVALLVQIAFLDALDNRVFWVLLIWIGMITTDRGSLYLSSVSKDNMP